MRACAWASEKEGPVVTINVSNQAPAVLDAVHTISCKGDYDPADAIKGVIADAITQPLNPAAPASLTDASGNDIVGRIPQMLLDCVGDVANPAAEAEMKDLLGQTMLHFDPRSPLPVGELFAVQAGGRYKMPAPGPTVLYTAKDDVIPAAKSLLAGKSDEGALFASLAYAYHPNTLGFWFQSSTAFDDFKAWLSTQVQTMSAALPGETTNMLNQFATLSLKGLTESLLLRVDDADGNTEFSFARLIVHMLMSYTQQQTHSAQSAPQQPSAATTAQQPQPGQQAPTVGVLPFTVGELFCPRSIVLVNVEAHARARPGKVTKEWRLINTSLSAPVKVVSNKALSKLTAMPRATAKAQAVAAKSTPGAPGNRAAHVRFRKQPPTRIDLVKAINRVLKRMGMVNRSQNIFRKSKTTFLKANRRNPDDYNKPGRITSVHFMPDLHIYIDTSGSISEDNYQQAVLMLIAMAKKMNVDLYVSSFSHILSEEKLLHVAGKSVAQVWKEFRRIPKVTGGTDYKQIWDYINASPARKRRMSLVITDFEWAPSSNREDHPPNLYYAPCSAMDWDMILFAAGNFAASMKHIDPAIKQRLLGVIV